MFQKTLTAVVLFACLVALGTARPSAAEDQGEQKTVTDPISGRWTGVMTESETSSTTFTLTLTLERGKVTGQIASPHHTGPIAGTWADGSLSLTFEYAGGDVTVSGTLKDGALRGEISFGGGGQIFPWTGKRDAAK